MPQEAHIAQRIAVAIKIHMKVQNKIVVIGAGAIGSLVGGLLSRAGEDVTLIGRNAHLDAINKNGLIIDY